MSKQRVVDTIIFLALIGVGLSLYSWLHNAGVASGSVCNVNDTFSCDLVNKGPYGNLAGIPVSLIGVIGYGILLIGAAVKRFKPEDRSLTQFLLLMASGGLLFSLYLTGLEAFVIHAWCLICLGSQAVMLALFSLVLYLFTQERTSYGHDSNERRNESRGPLS